MPDSTYADEAAAQLRLARDANEKDAGTLAELAEANIPVPPDEVARVNNRRMELAAAFTRLAELEQREGEQ